MTFFGLTVPSLNIEITSEHFSNVQLQELYTMFSLGNTLKTPNDIVKVAEYIYKYDNLEQFYNDDKNKQVIQYGLGGVFARAFEMREQS